MNILSKIFLSPKAQRVYRLRRLLIKAEMRCDYRRAYMLQKRITDISMGVE